MQFSTAVKDIRELPENPGFRVGYSRKTDGNMSYRLGPAEEVLENREQFFRNEGIAPDRISTFFTEHKDDIHALREYDLRLNALRGERVAVTDAIITTLPETAIFLTFADCVPFIVYDQAQHIMAFAHVGWRSMAMGFTKKVLRQLESAHGTRLEDCIAVIGPSIKKESYFFRDPIQAEWPAWENFLEYRSDGRTAIDLFGFCRHEALNTGILPENLYAFPVDTARDENMFSHYAGTAGGRPEKQGRFVCYGYLQA